MLSYLHQDLSLFTVLGVSILTNNYISILFFSEIRYILGILDILHAQNKNVFLVLLLFKKKNIRYRY